jgi:hypothetical protein
LTLGQHTDHISNGQRVSRYSLPPLLCFNFFPIAQKKLNFYCRSINGTFSFAPTAQTNPSAKAKEPFFSQRTALKM